MKKGISLMVLVITIIVIIILATTIVITLTNTTSIEKADEVVKENDIDKVQLMAELGLNEILKENNGNLIGVNVEEKLETYLKEKNVNTDKYQVAYNSSNTSKGQVTVSEITYIPIYTQEDLSKISFGGEEKLSDGNKYNMLNTAYYKLMNDITITEDFEPISRLNGRLYGNGKKIILNANYKIAECMIDIPYEFYAASLISIIGENGVVKDLGIEGTLNIVSSTQSPNIATIAGINIGTIDSCYSAVNITAGEDKSPDGAFIGGLVACNANTIINSYNTGNITSHSYYAGGLAGYSYNIRKHINELNKEKEAGKKITTGMITKNITVKIRNSYNTGNILSSVSGKDFDNRLGGLVAQVVYTEISSCYNSGNITNDFIVGGLIGSASSSSTIKDCYNTGTVSNYNSEESFVAGIIGDCDNDSTVYNCYNSGLIQATTDSSGDIRQIAASSENISALISKCYYLNTAGLEDNYATEATDSYMKHTTFTDILNTNSAGAWKAVTSGYPKLSWE